MQPANNTYSDLSSLKNAYTGQRNKRPRLGQLLVGAGLVSTDTLHNCLRAARRTNQKLGTVLVEKQLLSSKDLESALLAQKFIADGLVLESASNRLLQTASTNNTDLMTAITNSETTDSTTPVIVPELIDILQASALLKSDVLQAAREMSAECGMSFAKTLIVLNAVSTETLDAILVAIVFIRAGKITVQDTVKAIRDLRYNRIEVSKQTLSFPALGDRTSLALGDMLVQSRCLNDFECLFAIENALVAKNQLGQMLVSTGLVSETVVKEALVLQQFVARGCVTAEAALVALRRVEQDGLTLKEVGRELQIFKDSQSSAATIELLINGGYLKSDAVSQAIMAVAEYEMDPGKALLASGVVESSLYRCAASCIRHINNGNITVDQAFELISQTETGKFRKLANIELATDEACKLEAQKKVPPPIKTKSEERRDELKSLVESVELKQVTVLAVVLLAAALAILKFVPEHFHYQSLSALCAVVAITLFKIGQSRTARQKSELDEKKARLETAQFTKTRLEQRNK